MPVPRIPGVWKRIGSLARRSDQDIQRQRLTAFDDTGAVNAYVITPVPAISAYAKYQAFWIDFANANTGPSTLNNSALGARDIFDFRTGAALIGGEILAGLGLVVDDGTQYILMTSIPASRITIDTEQATTSGTAFDFTGIPADAKEIIVMLDGVSLSGSNEVIVQIGDAGGIEATGYVGGVGDAGNNDLFTVGFILRPASLAVMAIHSQITLRLMDPATNKWSAIISGGRSDASGVNAVSGGGTKSLSATLDRVRLTRNGTDTFDAGAVNIMVKT